MLLASRLMSEDIRQSYFPNAKSRNRRTQRKKWFQTHFEKSQKKSLRTEGLMIAS